MAAVPAGTWNVVGHEGAVRFLQRSLERGKLSHAYLFVGPPQAGKRTLAVELARAINCEGTPKPCGTCRPCQLIARDRHPDVVTVRGEGVKGAILVDQVRELRREASLAPVEGRRRVYILCGLELANENAANALLKTLEEPPAHVTFLLTTTSEELLTPTIVSRCQVLFLGTLPREAIQQALEQRWALPAERASLLAGLSGGRIGRALALHQSEQLLARRREALDQLQVLLAANWGRRFALAAEMARRVDQIPSTLEIWLSWWRDLLFLQEGLSDRVANLDRQDELVARRGAFGPADARRALVALQACAHHLRSNVSARLALERLMLHLPLAGG